MELVPTDKAKFTLAKGILLSVENIRDKAIVIQNTVGLEFVFTLIANGLSEQQIASDLGLMPNELKIICCSNPTLRKRYIEAHAFRFADTSIRTLDKSGLAAAEALDKYEKNATDFHSNNIDRVMKANVSDGAQAGVVINNTVVVRDKSEVPDVPADIKNVLDMEVKHVDSDIDARHNG